MFPILSQHSAFLPFCSFLSSLFPFRAPLFYLSRTVSFSHLAVVCGFSIKRHSIENSSNKDAWKHHGGRVADCALQSLALVFIPFPPSWEGKQEPGNLYQRKMWLWEQRGRVLLRFITLRRTILPLPKTVPSQDKLLCGDWVLTHSKQHSTCVIFSSALSLPPIMPQSVVQRSLGAANLSLTFHDRY